MLIHSDLFDVSPQLATCLEFLGVYGWEVDAWVSDGNHTL
jgi:hypothetical protein